MNWSALSPPPHSIPSLLTPPFSVLLSESGETPHHRLLPATTPKATAPAVVAMAPMHILRVRMRLEDNQELVRPNLPSLRHWVVERGHHKFEERAVLCHMRSLRASWKPWRRSQRAHPSVCQRELYTCCCYRSWRVFHFKLVLLLLTHLSTYCRVSLHCLKK